MSEEVSSKPAWFLNGGAFTLEANAFLDAIANEQLEKPFNARQLRELVQGFVQ